MSRKINRIVFATQKGGVGKSTMATMLASYMYFRQNHQVVVIDADHPQHSIKKLRNREMESLKEDEDQQRAFMKSGREQVYPIANSKMVDVFQRPSPDQPSTYEKASLPAIGADTIIIDTPGSVAIEGLGTILENVDHVIVPLEPEEMILISSSEFLAALSRMKAVKERGVKPIAFWNKVRQGSHQELIDVQNEVFRAAGIHVLENHVPYSVKMKRNETRSTIFPVNFSAIDLNDFMNELYSVVQ